MTIKHITVTIGGAVAAVALASLGVAAQVDAPPQDAPPAGLRGGVDDNNRRMGEVRGQDPRDDDFSQAEGNSESRAERDGSLPDQRALPDPRDVPDARAMPDERARAGEEADDRDLPEGDLDRDNDGTIDRTEQARDRDGDGRVDEGAPMEDGIFMGGGQLRDDGSAPAPSRPQSETDARVRAEAERDAQMRSGASSDGRTGAGARTSDDDVAEGGPQVAMLVADGRIERVGVDGAAHAHFTLVNRGSQDELMAISTRTASETSLRVAPDRNDPRVTQLVTDGVPVLNGTSMEFAESGNVAVLCGMSPNVKDGDTVNVTLWFDKAGAIEVPFVVGGEEALTSTEEVFVDDE